LLCGVASNSSRTPSLFEISISLNSLHSYQNICTCRFRGCIHFVSPHALQGLGASVLQIICTATLRSTAWVNPTPKLDVKLYTLLFTIGSFIAFCRHMKETCPVLQSLCLRLFFIRFFITLISSIHSDHPRKSCCKRDAYVFQRE
jgi:hypothetical protein